VLAVDAVRWLRGEDFCASGRPPEVGLGAVRFSMDRTTTQAEIDEVSNRNLQGLT
jgi:cysteine sulfinate desulfinase/cysteine desulfurase-like protein